MPGRAGRLRRQRRGPQSDVSGREARRCGREPRRDVIARSVSLARSDGLARRPAPGSPTRIGSPIRVARDLARRARVPRAPRRAGRREYARAAARAPRWSLLLRRTRRRHDLPFIMIAVALDEPGPCSSIRIRSASTASRPFGGHERVTRRHARSAGRRPKAAATGTSGACATSPPARTFRNRSRTSSTTSR